MCDDAVTKHWTAKSDFVTNWSRILVAMRCILAQIRNLTDRAFEHARHVDFSSPLWHFGGLFVQQTRSERTEWRVGDRPVNR